MQQVRHQWCHQCHHQAINLDKHWDPHNKRKKCQGVQMLTLSIFDAQIFELKKQSHPVVEPRSFAPSCSRFVVFLKPTCWICGRKGHRTKTHTPHQKITISGRLTIVKVKNNNLFPAKFNMSQEHRHIIQKITQNQQIFFFQVTLQRDGLQLGA